MSLTRFDSYSVKDHTVKFVYEIVNEAGQNLGGKHTNLVTPQTDITDLPEFERGVVEFARAGYVEPTE